MLTLIESWRNNGEHLATAPFAQLIEALLAPDERLFAMISLYCDASGKEQDPLISIGGVVSTAEKWRLFDDEWHQALKAFGLDYFRMSEFAHSVGQFASGWKSSEGKRRALLDRLIAIMISYVQFWTGVCVLKSDYDKVDADYELHERMFPYTVCAKACIAQANTWYEAHHREDGVEYVFESGDEHFPQLRREVEKDFGIIPIERRKRDATPCQAADFAAYEVLKFYRYARVELDKIFAKYRASFMRLTDMPSRWGQYGESELRILCRCLEYPRRQALK